MSHINHLYLEKITQAMRQADVDALLIAPSEELRFLIGFSPMYCERLQGLLIHRDGSLQYICNELSRDEIAEAVPELKVLTWHDNEGYHPLFEKLFSEKGLSGGKIAVSFTVRAFDIAEIMTHCNVRFINGKALLETARIRKNEAEMDALRRSSAVLDQALTEVLPSVRAGMPESQILDMLRASILAQGAQPGGGGVPDGYVGIVCSGPNGALPHYSQCTRVLQNGDAVIIDFNCSVSGMGADLTRTVFIGQADDQQRNIYDIVLKANLAGEAAARCGTWVPNVDRAARNVIEQAGYGKQFPYRLGHGIGYMLHEAPDIKACNQMTLAEGMAFSIEPGIYLPGRFGVRIEDVVLINSTGETEILNKVSKDLLILENRGEGR